MPENQFILSFTLTGLLVALLCIAAIVALVYLIIMLARISKAAGALADILERNRSGLSDTLATLPGISKKVESTLDRVDGILTTSSDDISDTISGARDTMENVARLSADAADSIEYIATTAIDTADTLSSGLSKSASQLGYIREVIDIIRGLIKK